MAEDHKCEHLVIIEDGDQDQSEESETGQTTEGQGERAEGQRKGPNAVKAEEDQNENQDKHVSEQNEQCDSDTTQEDGLCKPEQEPAETELQDFKKVHRLSPDFPDSLFELLCTLQEGRRLNDQRCSFTALEPGVRRRCHSEPNTTKPAQRVVFSSMNSLQREEFFDLVATAQARRLNDQRAQLERSAPQKTKSRSFRGSLKQLSLKKAEPAPVPAPVPKEELYSMILHTQAQGRLEDQRSRAPGPMDDEVFFS
ncbi:hypothetical protein NQD34_011639 [Periophthalmus magnuspinnatus]|nr:hypothetical protein NQD34_011639 [Periophthalmus magnuspinnatus]